MPRSRPDLKPFHLQQRRGKHIICIDATKLVISCDEPRQEGTRDRERTRYHPSKMSQEQYIGLHTLIDLANIQRRRAFIQVTHMPFYERVEVAALLLLRLTSRHAACSIIDVLEPLLIIYRTTPDYLELMKTHFHKY